MPAFVKSRGSWKSLDQLSVKDNFDWKRSQNGWVCQEWGMAEATVTFDAGTRTVELDLSPVNAAYLLPVGTVVQIRRADNKYFQAVVSVEAVDGVVTFSWTATTINAPGSSTDFVMTPGIGEVATHVLYWARLLSPAASVIGDTDVPETFGGVSETWPPDTGEFTVVKFTTPGTQQLRVSRAGYCDLVLMGAGGGGGYGRLKQAGGGGGAGKAVLVRNHWLDVGDHDVTVGTGGRAGTAPSTAPASGGFSQFRLYQAQGGGAGSPGSRGTNGLSGGSGGGGGGLNTGTSRTDGGTVAAPWTAIGSMQHSSLETLGSSGGRGGTIWGDGGQFGGGGGGGGGANSEGSAGLFGDDGLLSGGAGGVGVLFTEAAGRFVPGADFASTVFCRGGAGGDGTLAGAAGAAGAEVGSGGAGGNGDAVSGGAGANGAVYVIYRTFQGSGTEETPPTEDEEVEVIGDASGGTVIPSYTDTDGQAWKIHTFAASGTFTVATAGKFDLLLLGGGGGAGATRNISPDFLKARMPGGGGGGGGMLFVRNVQLPAGAYALSVGEGGVGGTLTGNTTTWTQTSATAPTAGGDTVFPGGFTAKGGGSGSQSASALSAGSGGCGGGAGANSGNPGSAIVPSVPATGFDSPHYVSGDAGYPWSDSRRGQGGRSRIAQALTAWLFGLPEGYASYGLGGLYDRLTSIAVPDVPGRGGYAFIESAGFAVSGGPGARGIIAIAYKI